jgi:hypothetical protein
MSESLRVTHWGRYSAVIWCGVVVIMLCYGNIYCLFYLSDFIAVHFPPNIAYYKSHSRWAVCRCTSTFNFVQFFGAIMRGLDDEFSSM